MKILQSRANNHQGNVTLQYKNVSKKSKSKQVVSRDAKTTPRSIHADRRSVAAHQFWSKHIVGQKGLSQQAVTAEDLFAHIWRTQGEEQARSLMLSPQSQIKMARQKFELGCLLWNQGKHDRALNEVNQSLRIQEAFGWFEPKAEVQVHYALGTIHLALNEHHAALTEFRRAWHASGLRFGLRHQLSQSAQHMVGATFQRMGFGVAEIHQQVNILKHCILHGREGDLVKTLGDCEAAVDHYREAFPGEEMSFEQAAIRTRMAHALELENRRDDAGEEWQRSLFLYSRLLGMEHPISLDTMHRMLENYRQSKR